MKYTIDISEELKINFKVKHWFLWLAKNITIQCRDTSVSKNGFKVFTVISIIRDKSYQEIIIELLCCDLINQNEYTHNITLSEYCNLVFGDVKDITYTVISCNRYMRIFNSKNELYDIVCENDIIRIKSSNNILNDYIATIIEYDIDVITKDIRLILYCKISKQAVYLKMKSDGFVTYCDIPYLEKSYITITRYNHKNK